MDHRLELTVLCDGDSAIALARRGADVATRRFNIGKKLPEWQAFRQSLLDQLRGSGPVKKIGEKEIEAFGRSMFDCVIGDSAKNSLMQVYDRLGANDHISWKILTDHSDLEDLPWEFLREPNGEFPRANRSVVRVLRTTGIDPPAPLPAGSKMRVLLVAAEPRGAWRTVGWEDIRRTLLKHYGAGSVVPEIIEGADLEKIHDALIAGKYDVVHFSCHGTTGRLVLVDSRTKTQKPVDADRIAGVLAGRGIRLVLLSACETSAGSAFGSTAATLIRSGIPAVVANQAPISMPNMGIFVNTLYAALLTSGNIDKAVSEARLKLKDGIEWGIPTLHRLYGGACFCEVK